MKAVHGVNEVPNPSVQTVSSVAPVTILLAPNLVVLGTLPSIKGGDVAKKIHFTCVLFWTRAEQVAFILYKDGVADAMVYMHDAGGLFTQTVNMHWTDTAPGKGTPVYEVRAYGNVGGATIARTRRLTVSNQ